MIETPTRISAARALALLAAFAVAAALAPRAMAEPAGFAFLEVPAGANASALGGAYATRADGVEAAFWNPAGLAATTGIQITGSHFEYLQQLRHDQFAFAIPVGKGGLAAGLRALYSEPITERDEFGNAIGTFGGHDLEFSLAYGAPIGGGWRAGGSAQVIREHIARSAATTWALGGGVTWEPPSLPALRLGLSGHNLGPAAHYKLDGGVAGEAVALPMAVQAGASYGLVVGSGLNLRGSLETRMTRGRSGVGMVGAELGHASGAAARIGYRANDDATKFGMGVGYGFSSLKLDYAFVPTELDLGDTHRFSLTARF